MQEIWIDYLNAIDAKALALSNDEILDAVTKALDAQGRGETVIDRLGVFCKIVVQFN